MKLSILICTIVEREEPLQRLLTILKGQMNNHTNKLVEILIEKDNRKMVVGTKRNLLLKRAQGKYVCFIDDDDLVSDDYISKILRAIKANPDVVGIKGIITRRKRKYVKVFIHSMKYKTWFEKNGIYYRCPNHLNPVKRKLALQVGFPEKNKGEDMDYSLRLRALLKREEYIKEPIYFYLAG